MKLLKVTFLFILAFVCNLSEAQVKNLKELTGVEEGSILAQAENGNYIVYYYGQKRFELKEINSSGEVVKEGEFKFDFAVRSTFRSVHEIDEDKNGLLHFYQFHNEPTNTTYNLHEIIVDKNDISSLKKYNKIIENTRNGHIIKMFEDYKGRKYFSKVIEKENSCTEEILVYYKGENIANYVVSYPYKYKNIGPTRHYMGTNNSLYSFVVGLADNKNEWVSRLISTSKNGSVAHEFNLGISVINGDVFELESGDIVFNGQFSLEQTNTKICLNGHISEKTQNFYSKDVYANGTVNYLFGKNLEVKITPKFRLIDQQTDINMRIKRFAQKLLKSEKILGRVRANLRAVTKTKDGYIATYTNSNCLRVCKYSNKGSLLWIQEGEFSKVDKAEIRNFADKVSVLIVENLDNTTREPIGNQAFKGSREYLSLKTLDISSLSKSKISDTNENFKSVDLVKPWDKQRGIKYDLFGNGKIAIREGKFWTFKKAKKTRIGEIKFE